MMYCTYCFLDHNNSQREREREGAGKGVRSSGSYLCPCWLGRYGEDRVYRVLSVDVSGGGGGGGRVLILSCIQAEIAPITGWIGGGGGGGVVRVGF
jgi:hypothetical protein